MHLSFDPSQRIRPCQPPVVPSLELGEFSATAAALQRAHATLAAATNQVFSLIDDHRGAVGAFISELYALDRDLARRLGGNTP